MSAIPGFIPVPQVGGVGSWEKLNTILGVYAVLT